ncbi:CDP-glycerol glycerophosphotransferase family protein [Actinocorallia sp. B10E7]|uniref:bifunctional glycosyltransferase/CDP-glycerol:glycerophosphate glycerophosphotransferase n=1 Tax=Actinocorallia sp. B10E7 TaxID=3153558 RepID=UPI00325CB045
MHLRNGASSPLLSVIVPFRDLSAYLPDCLRSLAAQSYPELEVVMVDDGSTDDGAVAAKAMADRDPRFRLVQQEHSGPGPARNTGVARAAGRYLAFADGDDVVPPDAYRLLVETLERTGSDFATGNVLRMSEGRTWQSALHRDVFTEPRERTRASLHPLLVRDRTPWNKVFRRSFWDDHGFTFPEGLYEDPPVILTAHAVARSVDVLSETVYHWRRRPGSITEERHAPANLLQRLRSTECVRQELAVRAPELVPAYDRHVLLGIELRVVFSALAEPAGRAGATDSGAMDEVMELATRLASELGPETAGDLTAFQRLRLHLLREGRREDLRELLRFAKAGGHRSVPVVREDKHWHARYPFADSVPHGLCDVTRELEAVAGVDRAAWEDGVLELEGHAYIRWLESEGSRIRLWLRAVNRFGRIRVPLERVDRPDVTADSGQELVDYDGSGFRARIPASSLKVLGRLRPSDWRLEVEVACQGARLRCTPTAPRSSVQKWPTAALVQRTNSVLRVEAAEKDGEYVLRVRPQEATLVAHRMESGRLVLEGTLTRAPRGPLQMVLARKDAKVRLAAEVNGLRFRAEVPAVEPDGLAGLATGSWEVRLGGFRVQASCPDEAYSAPGGELVVSRTRHGVLRLLVRRPKPVVRRLAWTDGELLELTGSYLGADRPSELVLRHRRSGQEHRIPLEWKEEGFTAVIRPRRMPRPFGEVALGGGRWTLHLDGQAVLVSRDILRELPGPHVCGWHEYTPAVYRMDALELQAKAGPHGRERGRYAREGLLRTVYRRRRSQPVRDLALFDAYRGHEYSCNPRGLFEELRRRELGLECVWVTADGAFPAPEGARLVLAGSREHFEALACARYVFGNFVQEPWYAKTPGQTYVQGWHGVPYGVQEDDGLRASLRRLAGPSWREHDVPQWDLALAQNAWSERLFREVFGYGGEILTTGHPRTDPLHRLDASEAAAGLRRALGVPEGGRAVLYLPACRSDPRKRATAPLPDLNLVSAALGDDQVLLSRAPHAAGDGPRAASILDVSAWPDPTVLCLAADVLVTDHFPALVDFAGTGRPAILLAADGEAPAPGPVAADTDELIDALTRPEESGDRHRAFVERHCPHDDGWAASRVLDHLGLR